MSPWTNACLTFSSPTTRLDVTNSSHQCVRMNVDAMIGKTSVEAGRQISDGVSPSPTPFAALTPCTICNFKWRTNDSKSLYVDFSRLCQVGMTSHSPLPFTYWLRKWLHKLISHLISVYQLESHSLTPTLISDKGALCALRAHTQTQWPPEMTWGRSYTSYSANTH